MSDKKKKENQIFSNLEFKKKTFNINDAKPLFSKDGSSLYIFSENVCHLYSTTTGNYIKKLFSCSSKIISYHLHPLDENFLVTITENGEVTVYNLKENKIEHSTNLCINKTLLCSLKIQKFSSEHDENCDFDWNSIDLENIGNRKFIHAVVKPFQGDSGNLLIWASWCLNDETEAHISVFSYQSGTHYKDFAFKQCKLKKCSKNFVLSNSQEHDVFIGISEHCLNVAHFQNKDSFYYSIRKHYTGLNNTVICVAFHPTEYCFATGDSIGRIIIWKNIFEQYPLKEMFHWHTLAVNDLIFSKLGSKNLNILSFDPRSNSIVLNGKTGHIQFLSLKDFNKLNYTFDVTNRNYVTPHTTCSVANTEVNHAIFSPKGDWMITAESRIEKDCYESFLKFWNYVPENGSYKLNTNVEFPHGGVEIYSLEISSSSIVGSTGPDKRFCLWAIEEQINGNVIKEIWSLYNDRKYRNFSSYALDFSKDSSLVAVTFGSVVTIWETDSCLLKCSLSCPNNKNDLKACKFGNNEFTHLIIAGSEFNVCCWNSLTLSMVWTVPFNLSILASDPIGNNMVLFSKKVVVIFSPSSPTSLYLKNYNLESPVIAAKILPDNKGKFSVLILTENYELHCLEHVDTDPVLLKNSNNSNQDPSVISSTPYSSQIPQIQNENMENSSSSKKLISVLKNKRETVSQLLDSPAHTLSNPSLLCSHGMVKQMIVKL
ncbi:hypothetical protein Phum_PHUM404710 [Pediculus humanus corporis]|uniref:WD repeat-containing protein 75 second beta-propeller domain-containing protein n=1 Tax=Pediculus humanus subsp. corporis TaxID=121224 RepID=E0VRU2_PEDHC|nr:uncharacterized protein Phum_PHUM404710 [Pediculus humanus corporis]EEB16098.1 hypothetical protein Phum_PHUM404710 [Pediculus humanus corporis]